MNQSQATVYLNSVNKEVKSILGPECARNVLPEMDLDN
jgi:hypothetical protein